MGLPYPYPFQRRLRFRPVRPVQPARDKIPGTQPARPFGLSGQLVASPRERAVRLHVIDASGFGFGSIPKVGRGNQRAARHQQTHHRPTAQHPTRTTHHTAGAC